MAKRWEFYMAGLELRELTRFPNHIIETGGHFFWDIYALYNEIIGGLKVVARPISSTALWHSSTLLPMFPPSSKTVFIALSIFLSVFRLGLSCLVFSKI